MKKMCLNNRVVAFILLTSLGSLGIAYATDLTGGTGVINGTAPVIYNGKNEPDRVDFSREYNNVDEGEELDIADKIELTWKVTDAEGDQEITLPTVEWICTDASSNKHVLATAINEYVIHPADKGCTIGVNITPTTLTGVPRENAKVSIADISSYDDNDNIPTGPVNPHILNIINYIVAPNNQTAKYTVPADAKLQTAYAGAQIQIVTDNVADQIDEWTTSNPAIATVSDTGLVTIKAKGGFRITARHNEVKASIIFNPQLFFIFNTEKPLNWYDAKAWCENQGYRLPTDDELSTKEGARGIPSGSLWQEWGSSMSDAPHKGVVLWSSSLGIAAEDAYFYMYISSGHMVSNHANVSEGVTCIVP